MGTHTTDLGNGIEFVRGVDGTGAEHGAGPTPGPWEAKGPDDFGDYTITQAGKAPAIAAVVSNARDPKVVAADARLIRAAPDLLDALSYAAAENVLPGYVLDVAAAAIAKARGDNI